MDEIKIGVSAPGAEDATNKIARLKKEAEELRRVGDFRESQGEQVGAKFARQDAGRIEKELVTLTKARANEEKEITRERLHPFDEIGEIAVEEFLGYVRRNGVHAPRRASTHEVTPTHSRCVHPFEPRIDRAEKRIEPSGDVVANPTGLQHALIENNEERWQQIEQPEPAQPFPEPIEFRAVHACIQRWRRALSAVNRRRCS